MYSKCVSNNEPGYQSVCLSNEKSTKNNRQHSGQKVILKVTLKKKNSYFVKVSLYF